MTLFSVTVSYFLVVNFFDSPRYEKKNDIMTRIKIFIKIVINYVSEYDYV